MNNYLQPIVVKFFNVYQRNMGYIHAESLQNAPEKNIRGGHVHCPTKRLQYIDSHLFQLFYLLYFIDIQHAKLHDTNRNNNAATILLFLSWINATQRPL